MQVSAFSRVLCPGLETDRARPTIAKLGSLCCFWALLAVPLACRSAEQREVSRDLATIVHAVDQLRTAPSDDKAGPLQELEKLACQSPPGCELMHVCSQAYRLHLAALSLTAEAKAALSAGKDAALVDSLLQRAQRDLEHAREGAHQCVQLQGALTREYKL